MFIKKETVPRALFQVVLANQIIKTMKSTIIKSLQFYKTTASKTDRHYKWLHIFYFLTNF